MPPGSPLASPAQMSDSVVCSVQKVTAAACTSSGVIWMRAPAPPPGSAGSAMVAASHGQCLQMDTLVATARW